MKTRITNIFWISIIALICVIDQLSKYLIIHNVTPESPVTVVNNFLYFNHIKNTGAAMGLLQNGRIIFIPITIIVTIVLFCFLFKSSNKILKTSLSFIIGGAIGNLIDRIFVGRVTDFLDFRMNFFKLWKWIFNVADVFVVVGTIILAFYMLFIYKEKEKTKA